MDEDIDDLRTQAEELEAQMKLHEDHLQDFQWDMETLEENMENEESELAEVRRQYNDVCAQIKILEFDAI